MPDDIKQSIKDGLKDAGETIGKHSANVMGDKLTETIEDAKKMTGVLFKPLLSAVKGDKEKESKSDKQRNDYLERMVEYFNAQEKRAGRMLDPKEKKSPWYALMVGLGLVVGAIAGAILMPFRVLLSALKFIGKITGINKLLKLLPSMPKMKGIRKFSKVVLWITKKLPLLGTFFSAVKTGFKFLGWPLQIIFSLIDFMRGFTNETGSIEKKIKAGLVEVVTSFIKLPMQLFGWIADWALGLVDIKVKGGSAVRMMDALLPVIKGAIDFLMWYWKKIGGAFVWMIQKILPPAITLVEMITGGLVVAFDAISAKWEEVKPSIQEFILAIPEKIGKIKSFFSNIPNMLNNVVSNFVNFFTNIGSGAGAKIVSIKDKMAMVLQTVFMNIIDLVIGIFDWIPGIDGEKIKKDMGLQDVKSMPTEYVENSEAEKRKLARYGANERKKEVKLNEENQKKQLEATNKMTRQSATNTAVAVNSQTRGSGENAQPIRDESENTALGLAMGGNL